MTKNEHNPTSSKTPSHRLHLAVEGIDGTGKSTAVDNVAGLLVARGLSVSVVHYTQRSGRVGQIITSIYHQDKRGRVKDAVAGYRSLQAALYGVNGRMNLRRRERGTDVLLADRSILSGYASHVGRVPEWVLNTAESSVVPDVIAYLTLPLDKAVRRIDHREAGSPGYEEDLASLEQFRDDYERVLARPPRRLQSVRLERVNADQSEQKVAQTIATLAFSHLRMKS